MASDGLPQEFVTFGPEYPGLDEWNEPGSTGGARKAQNTRRDEGILRGLPVPYTLRTDGDGTEDLRGLHCHTKADGTPVLLSATGYAMFSDDGLDSTARVDKMIPLFWDGTTVTLTDSTLGYVVFAQNGVRSFFVETGL